MQKPTEDTIVDELIHHLLHEKTLGRRIISEPASDSASVGRQFNMKRVDLEGRARNARAERAPEIKEQIGERLEKLLLNAIFNFAFHHFQDLYTLCVLLRTVVEIHKVVIRERIDAEYVLEVIFAWEVGSGEALGANRLIHDRPVFLQRRAGAGRSSNDLTMPTSLKQKVPELLSNPFHRMSLSCVRAVCPSQCRGSEGREDQLGYLRSTARRRNQGTKYWSGRGARTTTPSKVSALSKRARTEMIQLCRLL